MVKGSLGNALYALTNVDEMMVIWMGDGYD
jgi:hypothetical protein